MFNNTVVDVAIGLTFVFLMLSVACSLLNERIQSALDRRAAMLEDALRKLLGDDPKSPFAGVKSHALVRAIAHSADGMPSYLPSSTFVLALFDTLVPADGEHPLTIKRLRDAVMLMDKEIPKEPSGWLRRAIGFARRRTRTAAVSVPTGRAALLVILHSSDNDVGVARAKVERWFDSAMERLSGTYKRHVTVWLLVLGFVLAAATNADSIQLVQRLERESALRAAVSAQVEQASHTPNLDQRKPDLEQLDQLDLLFWDNRVVTGAESFDHPRAMRQLEWSPQWLRWLLLKIAGFMMTALAVSLGAPFCFDLLGRLVNPRATGARPPRSATEPSRRSRDEERVG